MSPPLAGIYRGVVESNADPEQRKRYRVRVANVHYDSVPVTAIPWAELVTFGGKGFGDIPHFEKGDNVFVMFEGGDRRFPVVLGGWLSEVGGTPDLPAQQQGDYENAQAVWVRQDRFGNQLVMNATEGWVELESKKTRIRIDGETGVVTLTGESKIDVNAPSVSVNDADTVVVQAREASLLVAETVTVLSEDVVNIRAANVVNIGHYEDPVTGALDPKRTPLVDIEALQTLKLSQTADGGSIDMDAAGTIAMDSVGAININSQTSITIQAANQIDLTVENGSLNINADGVNFNTTDSTDLTITTTKSIAIEANNDVTITSGGRTTIEVGSSAEINVTGNATVETGGSASITAQGNATVEANGLLSLKSNSRIELEAPTIDLTASSLLSMEGTGLATLEGGTVLIN